MCNCIGIIKENNICEFFSGASMVGLQVEKITKAFANTILDAINSMYENSSTL